MRKAASFLFAVAVLTGATGCSDDWRKLLTIEVTLNHEYNDVLMKIVDDDSAKFYKEGHIEKIKNTWTELQKRKETYIKIRFVGIASRVNSIEELKASKALADLKEEIMFQFSPNYVRECNSAISRRRQQLERIKEVVDQLGPGTDTMNITQMLTYHRTVFAGQTVFNQP
jgi:hypothetical protein